ncbi:MAG: UDP-N-acetylmuramoyl-tripeptide--D-alanyl-D-alanine ligase, partial [Phycisphaerae bacterium]|nr:UDP-N-acetylmuramoyl-tripeptide--D-alanyl-D-alanine ligase [Phycisphaerae bacterium]
PLGLSQIRTSAGGQWVRGTKSLPRVKVTAITTDTRTAKPGELFVAILGEHFDGHAFLPQAGGAGCVAAVVSAKADVPTGAAALFPGGLIVVDDTVAAVGRLAGWHRRRHGAKVIAVTGSNGKTTVKGMIHHILSRRLVGSCGPKSFNNFIGVPLTLLAVGEADAYVACELGTSAPGEIAALASIAKPDVAVITSIGPTHLEKLGSVAKVAAEKAAILRHLAKDGLAVLPCDSPELDKVLRRYKGECVRFGAADGVEFRLTGYESFGSTAPAGAAGGQSPTRQSRYGDVARFEVNGRLWVTLPLPGRYNAVNALAAMAVANHFGIAPPEAAEALADFTGAPMRMERVALGGVTVINDAYNANPASVAAAAEVLSEEKALRRVMVVGDMRELGEQAPALHAATGAEIAARAVDLLVCVGELGRYIAVGAAEGGLQTVTYETVEAAARGDGLPRLLRPGDAVLIKGSRAVGMERLIEPIRAAFAPAPDAVSCPPSSERPG